MSEERGFEVVDRRGVQVEPEAREPEAPQAAVEETAAPEATAEDAEPQAAETEGGEEEELDFSGFNPFAGVTVGGILQMCAGLLNERAWVDMGMVADPGTGKVERRLEEAKRAIDVLGDLARHLEPLSSPEERRELQTALTNLRLNFARQRDSG